MSEHSRPEPRSIDRNDPVSPSALVLPAVAFEPPLDERRAWLERHEIVDALELEGLETPLFLTGDGVAITTTELGKSEAATTVATLCASPGVDLSTAYVLTAGIAGSSPSRAALGSVILADAIVDWDRKHRWDPDLLAEREGPPIDRLPYDPEKSVHFVNGDVLEPALAAAREVDLETDDDVRAYQHRYPGGVTDGPTVDVGPTVCGDEFWHGPRYAREVEWYCGEYGLESFATTEMEDAATATALERFGLFDRYVSVRAVANYDRPAPDQSIEESFEGIPESLALATENAARVGVAVVDELREHDPLGLSER
ncbi:phosphorylase [Natrialbaceae archaeon AArc-T1-2]|uniref:phosphorylase family protein n=1 Tax=Natrialbaceae archaeon AArc-T1-2 TaxID=3053904 RepID=UPI00255AF886|nr:phosphorylase [Natrialbaceae archaeon AArc-T1-2]WIV67798.1 phosphorylase [Natrialbaceae archaeon AArc-T1-2]